MDFIKKMKKREYIEMGLKTAIGVLLGIIVIFFMEAMIYSIYIKSIDDKTSSSSKPETSVYYIEKEGDNKYDIYAKDNVGTTEKPAISWRLYKKDITKASLDALMKDAGAMYREDDNLYKVEVTFEDDSTIVYVKADSSPHAQILAEFAEDATYFDGATFTVSLRETEESEFVETYKDLTYNQYLELHAGPGEMVKYNNKIINHKPNAFDIYLNGVHYAVMIVFLLAIGGIYTWRFILINKEYNKIEKRYKKTGKVFKG